MAQKIKPNSLRLGLTKNWQNRWFPKKNLNYLLEEDCLIRKEIEKRAIKAGLADIGIERMGNFCRVIIKAGRPGLLIGRAGKGAEELKKAIETAAANFRRKRAIKEKPEINLNIEELGRGEISASVAAQNIVFDLEKRMHFRRVMKQHLEMLMQNKEVRGAKIHLAGRLDGAEIARREHLAQGQMPLTNLRANIDYGEATAFTAYGTIGVKVWLYKGEIFER